MRIKGFKKGFIDKLTPEQKIKLFDSIFFPTVIIVFIASTYLLK